MDGWRKVGGRHAGPGGGAGVWGPLQGWPGTAGVPGVAGPPSCVGGGGIPRWFSWWPGCVLVFSGPRAAPSPPSRDPCCVCLPAPPHRCRPSSLSRACARLCPLPPPLPAVWDRAGLASRGCRLPASVGRWRPRVEQCPRSPEREAGQGGEPWRAQQGCPCEGWGGRWYAAGERSPGPAAAPGVGLAVGVRPREGCAPSPPRGGGGRRGQSVVLGVPRDRPCAGRPLAVRSRGAPWRPTRFPRVVSSHPPRGGARPPPPPPPVLWRWCHMAAPCRCPSPSVRPSASVRSPSAAPRGPRPGVSRFPGPAAAPIRCPLCRRRRLSADVVAGWARGSARDPPHPPTSPPPAAPPAPMRSPERGSGPRSASRGPVAASSPPGVPRPSGVGGTDGRLRARRPAPAWPGRGSPARLPGPPGRAGSRRGVGVRRRRGTRRAPPLVPPRGGGRRGALCPSWTEGCVRDRASSPRVWGRWVGWVPSRPHPLLPASSPRRVFWARPLPQLARVSGHHHPPCSRHARLLVLAPLPG